MESHRILFEQLKWESPQPGVRFKVFRDETRLSQEFVEPQWCTKGHVGFVLSGELEIDFSGDLVRFPEGSAILILAGEAHAHKARAITPVVRLFLVEEAST